MNKILYLVSDEYTNFNLVRSIIEYKKIKLDNRLVLVANVDIPLIGQPYGYGGKDINTFYLINRFGGEDLDKLDSFPIYVHVLIKLHPDDNPPSSLSQLQNIAWACIFDSKKSAEEYLKTAMS